MTKTLLASAALLVLLPAHADISVSSPAFTYSENFDSLSTSTTASAWVNDGTLAGWSLINGAVAAVPTILGGSGSTNTGSFYSFGTAGSGERALGSTASGGAYFGSPASGAVAGWIALALNNASGGTLDAFSVAYDGEQWRNGGNTNAQSLVLEYGFGSSFGAVPGWTAISTFTSPVIGATAAAVDGNGAGLVGSLGATVASPWAAGDTLWLRWSDLNDVGNDHGLAIDNLSFSVGVVPEPQAWALMLAGLGALGFIVRRRA
ncbi:MAG: PEP-CTERM sorting domain-containing protein [Rubrivivax sp.]|nr:PEP-CTERM sorting domain-containing protein [Rubrivivax sp.]